MREEPKNPNDPKTPPPEVKDPKQQANAKDPKQAKELQEQLVIEDQTQHLHPGGRDALQEYPAWRFHPEHAARIVQSEEEGKKLGAGWVDSASKLPQPGEPYTPGAPSTPVTVAPTPPVVNPPVPQPFATVETSAGKHDPHTQDPKAAAPRAADPKGGDPDLQDDTKSRAPRK